MRVAVLGGGPSGAMAAEHLADAGLETLLFDEKAAWEKPCGGGVTFKSYSQYPFLQHGPSVKKVIRETVIAAPGVKPVKLQLEQPLLIYSRVDLNGLLLDRAVRSGAQIEETRVLSAERHGTGWAIQTKRGKIQADHCIVATGARNSLRDFGTHLTPRDTMGTAGYFVPGERDRIDLVFLPELEGYIWVFPRCGHMSVGICGKGEANSSLRNRLHRYMDENAISREGATFYSHLLPCLEQDAWQRNRVAGEGWMATGDAAGLVDPVTGEGIYYAIRSGDLAAQSILEDGPERASVGYRKRLKKEFTLDLEVSSRLASRLFRGKFLGAPMFSRMVQFARLSPTVAGVIQDLFAGTQPYADLKNRLMRNLPQELSEIAWNSLRRAA